MLSGRVYFCRFIADSDKEWFDIELLNTVEQEFNEDVVEVIREPRYFVDFMRDAPEPTGKLFMMNIFIPNYESIKNLVLNYSTLYSTYTIYVLDVMLLSHTSERLGMTEG